MTWRTESPTSPELHANGDVKAQGHQRGYVLKLIRSTRSVAFAGLACAGFLAAPTQAQAGLFDFLFGAQQRAVPQQHAPSPGYSRAPLDVRVNPQRRKASGVAKVRPGKERNTKLANKSIDPRQHPNWFLEDPTLRRGDIVVLPTGVMVYQGGSRPQTKEDFARLDDSHLVSKKERGRIQDMVGPPTVMAEKDDPAKGKEATGPTNPVQ